MDDRYRLSFSQTSPTCKRERSRPSRYFCPFFSPCFSLQGGRPPQAARVPRLGRGVRQRRPHAEGDRHLPRGCNGESLTVGDTQANNEQHCQIFPGVLCWEWGGDHPKCKPEKSLITRAGPGAGTARTKAGAMLSWITCLCLFVRGEIVLHNFAEHRNSKKGPDSDLSFFPLQFSALATAGHSCFDLKLYKLL